MGARKFKRISYTSQAMIMSGNQRFEAVTKDLCLNGLFISTDQNIPVGQLAAISLKMPSISRSSDIHIYGVVVRNSPRGVALRFNSLDHETFDHLKRIIKRKPLTCH